MTDGRLGQWESGNERVAIDLTVCDIDLELCNEGVELLDNVGDGLSGDSTEVRELRLRFSKKRVGFR